MVLAILVKDMPAYPWVVEVAFASLNEHDLEVVVQIGQTASHNTSGNDQSKPS